jgi:alpha-1,3-rhamnosyltransferase
MDQPVVTIGVLTYNSSKYIIETLESIKAQTYPKLILNISDDCSTDNTIDLCKQWIEENRDRFVKTKIIVPEHNTGVSGNANRNWDACETEWFKDIAGDDLLLPNCIEYNMKYVNEHPETIVLFSRVRPFRVHHGKKIWEKESWHDYNFFNLTPEEQYHYLFYNGNHLPAAPCFYNIKAIRNLNIRHDERIPLLEDYPKWIMLVRKGTTFSFMDKHTVGYRQNENSLSVGLFSPRFYKSNLLFYLYYYLDEIKQENNKDKIYNLMCDEALKFYTKTYNYVFIYKNSIDYKLGHLILYPFRYCKKKLKLIFKHERI